MGTLAQVADVTGGQLFGTDQGFSAVSTDTRTLNPGDLFFALKGERFDASDFVATALQRGAAGAVVEKLAPVELSQVEVENSLHALGTVAREWRNEFAIPLIGITGSNGKTTIKELTAAIMRAAFPAPDASSVLATQGNFNNEIGLPLTLFQLRTSHKAAVIEMGASKKGDIAILAAIALPQVAVISNAARAHLEGFGSVADVAATKGEILDGLDAEGTAVLNHGDAFFAEWSQRAIPAQVTSFGESPLADFHAKDITTVNRDGTVGFEFDLVCPLGTTRMYLPLAGQHNVLNALAAAAAATAAGADLHAVRVGLAHCANVPGRLRTIALTSGATIFDDSYNANPDSVAAAIRFLASLDGANVLVLGDMGELGPDAEDLHRDIGVLAHEQGVEALYCIGELGRAMAEGFGRQAQWFADQDALFAALKSELQPGRNVLIKASRFMALDQLVKRLETASDNTVPSKGQG